MKPNFQKFLSRKHALLTDDILISAWNDKKLFKRVSGVKEYIENLEIIDGDFYFDMHWMDHLTSCYYDVRPQTFWVFIKKGCAHGERVRVFARKINISGSPTQLQNNFWKSVKLLKNLLVFTPETHPLAKVIENKVIELLKRKKVPENKISELLFILSAPTKKNDQALEQLDLNHIKTRSAQQKKFDLAQAIKKHAMRYAYLGYREPFSLGYSEAFFTQRLHEANVPHKPVALPKNIAFNVREKTYIALLREFVYFRNYRAEKLYESLYYIEQLWKKISIQHGLGETDLAYYTLNEIKEMFKNGAHVPKNIITTRKNGYGILLHNYKIKIITGAELNQKKTVIDNEC